MDTERRSWEFAAIPLTIALLGILGVIMWAFTQGLWVWVALGVVLLCALVVVALVYMTRPHHPLAPKKPALPVGAASHVDDGVHRVLVIADDACSAGDLGAALAEHRGSRLSQAFVLAPVLGSRTGRWTSDEHAYEEAGKHLEATVAALGELGITARGHVGSHDPLQAADDGLREFPADEIVFAVHPQGETNWIEEGVVESARSRFPISVSGVTVQPKGS